MLTSAGQPTHKGLERHGLAQRHAAKVGRRVMGKLKQLERRLEDAGLMPDGD